MTGQAAKKNRACARLEREDRSEMKRYFCAFLLLVLLALTACEGAPSPVTADSQGGGFAASDRSAEGCAHEPVTDPRAAPTCTEPGRTEGAHCARCGAVLTAQEEIPAAGHKPSTVQRREPTCTEDGFEGESKCSVCGEVLAEARTLPALGHTTDNGRCTRCGEKDPNYVAPEFKDAASIRDYAKDAVAWAAKEGIVKGDDNGNFLPTADITRQDFVTMLWRLDGEKKVTPTINFTDLTQNWYKDAVAWAVENGITKGVGGNRFAPNDTCTRGQAAAFMYRLAQLAK